MKIDLDKYPYILLMCSAFAASNSFAAKNVNNCIQKFGENWVVEFEDILKNLFQDSDSLMIAIKGYTNFAISSMRLQILFERELKYKVKTYEQAAKDVYYNERHMLEEYLPGLLLSHFLWPHHYRQIQFFENTFVKAMQVSDATSFIEVGVGTGLYSNLILRKMPAVIGIGLDISPYSKVFSERLMRAFDLSDRYEVVISDVANSSVQYNTKWLICVEVLEHLSDPLSFLRSLKNQMAPGARAFITAALNSAHSDHIYLYRNANEVLAQLVEVGFTLEQSFVGPAYKPTSPGVPVPEAAAFIVY